MGQYSVLGCNHRHEKNKSMTCMDFSVFIEGSLVMEFLARAANGEYCSLCLKTILD